MAVTASGFYGLTLEKMMNATSLPTSGHSNWWTRVARLYRPFPPAHISTYSCRPD